jgi:hypothetical protein
VGAIQLRPQPVKNAYEYVIERNGEAVKQIKAGEELLFTDILELYGIYIYSYYAKGILGNTLDSQKVYVQYEKGLHPRILNIGTVETKSE